MKNIFLSLCLVLSLGLAACGSSVDSKIERVNELEKQLTKFQEENGDDMTQWSASQLAEWEKMVSEDNKLRQEIAKEKLTPEQDANFDKAKFGNL